MKKLFFLFVPLIFMLSSCKEDSMGQQPIDSDPPGPVSEISAQNTAGGAILTYKLPADEDLLYIKAVYERKDGTINETRASLYSDALMVEGFADTKEREVSVIAVDRSRNESSAVKVKVNPLEPPVVTIGNSLNLVPDFGGVLAIWENLKRVNISVAVLKEDSNKEYVPIETFYSTVVSGKGASRGLDTIKSKFGVFAKDHWGNVSQTKYFELTPLYETIFDKAKFRSVELPGDVGNVGGWEKTRMWDNEKGNNGYSSPGGTGVWPHSVTIDLGIVGQISRLRLFQRQEPYIFAEGNLKEFEIWGCENLDASGNWASWTKLMDCKSVKPSGLSIGQNSNEDIDVAKNGEDFINSPTNPKVRYIRIKVLRTWAGGDNFQISEIDIYGDNR